MTKQTLISLLYTVDFNKHRLFVVDNNSCQATKAFYPEFQNEFLSHSDRLQDRLSIILLDANAGTSKAVNKAWQQRLSGENAIKMDNDIIVHCREPDWIDQMEEVIRRDCAIGQVALKRKDLMEHPKHKNEGFRSELIMLPHEGGQTWIIVEKVNHVIGSCVMHSAALLDKVGYLYQPSLYGYDDVLMSHRTSLSGFYSCFLPHIEIDHIDPGDTQYQDWKYRHSSEQTQAVMNLIHEMHNGTKPIYYEA